MSDTRTALRINLPTATWRCLYPFPQTEEEWEQYRKEAKAYAASGGSGSSSLGYGLAIGAALGGGI